MKKFYSFILALLFAFNLNAQWEEIASDVLPIDQRVWSVKMVDPLIGWCLSDNWITNTFIDNTLPLEYLLHRTEDGGRTWRQVKFSDPFTELLDFTPIGKDGVMASVIYGATGENLLMWTFDFGNKWDTFIHGSSDEFLIYTHFFDSQNGFALGSDFRDTTYRTDLFFITENGGDSWTEFGGINWETPPGFSLPAPKDTFIGDWILAGGYSFYNGAYSANHESLMFSWAYGDIWMTNDKGKNWKEIKTPFTDLGYIASVHAIKDENNFMVATDTDYDFRFTDPFVAFFTNDGGETWKESILPKVNTASAKYLSDIDAYVIMGSYGTIQGTIITYDEGDSWRVIDEDRRIMVSDFIDSKSNLGTFGHLLSEAGDYEENGKFYRLNIPDISNAKDLPTIEWLTIAPNPANDFIQIQLPSLFDKPDVHYEIFDESGRLILKKEGIQSELDISKLAVGKYSLKISTPSQLFMSRFVKI